MTWQIYLIISITFLSLNGLFHRSLMKEDNSDPRAQAVVFLTIGGIFATLIALLRGTFNLGFPPNLLINFIIVIFVLTIAYITKYGGFKLIGASEVVIFATTSKIWNVIGASIFLHETISVQKLLGTVIILIGVAITLYKNQKFKINKGIFLVLLSAFLFGFGDINGYFILKSIDASNYQIYASFLPVIALLIIQPKVIKKLKYYFTPNKALKVATLGIFDTLGMLSLFFAYKAGGNASIIGPLSATKAILTVLLAVLILKEKDNIKNKLIGAIVAILGVFLLV